MSFFADHLLSIIIFLPLAAAVICLAFPRTQHSGIRGFAFMVCLIDLLLAVWMWTRFEPTNTGMQMVESIAWVPSFGIKYSVGVDGVAVLLVVLTTFFLPLVVLSTYSGVKERIREYIFCMLLLQTGILGAFLATDLFLFYVFWELMLIPMYFLIGIWGHGNRIYAALKFFLYTMAGSLLMLVAILYTVWALRDGGLTFDWAQIASRAMAKNWQGADTFLFLAFAVAFAIKVPMFPFHTWLPDAHVEAPTGGSVILAGVLLKLGTFGFLRYAFWLFPEAAVEFLPAIALLAVIGIIYGALVAMVQKDLKRLVAYSSVSHLGFVVLGIAALTVNGITGGVVQMINHGISTGALFFLVGVIYERRHTRLIADFGGLAKVMPWYAFVWGLITMSSIGVPGLNGFVGEFLILIGTFQSTGIGIETATGDVAWAGIVAVVVIAVVVLVLLATTLLRQPNEKVGWGTKLVTLIGGVVVAAVVAAPPVGTFTGGLLVRPLVGVADSTAAFSEMFATLAVFGASGVIFAAVYLLWATQRVFFGPVTHKVNQSLKDLSLREGLVFAPLVIAAVVLGVYPKPILDMVEPTVQVYAQKLRHEAGIRSARAGAPLPATRDPRFQPLGKRRDRAGGVIPSPRRLRPQGLPLPTPADWRRQGLRPGQYGSEAAPARPATRRAPRIGVTPAGRKGPNPPPPARRRAK